MIGKKILIHDYAGHPFQLDLSIALANNGYEVIHIYTSSSGGPKAGFDRTIDNLQIINFSISNINKSNFVKRFFQEKEYGKNLVKEIDKINPDIVISANTPLSAQNLICDWSKKNNKKFIFWLQDIISVAASSILRKKIGFIGKIVSIYFKYLEKKILNNSDAVMLICDQFNDVLKDWNIQTESYVIPQVAKRIFDKENPFKIYGHNQTRSFCYIDDAVNGLEIIMNTKKCSGKVFHLGSNIETNIKDLIELCFDISRFNPDIELVDPPLGSVNRRLPDIKLLSDLTNYKPEFSLEYGLEKSLKWYFEYYNTN